MTRRATIRTSHDDPAPLARALEPDHTDEMETRVEGSVLETRVERETTGGLQATVDDYVVNLAVAVDVRGGVIDACDPGTGADAQTEDRHDADPDTTTDNE